MFQLNNETKYMYIRYAVVIRTLLPTNENTVKQQTHTHTRVSNKKPNNKRSNHSNKKPK